MHDDKINIKLFIWSHVVKVGCDIVEDVRRVESEHVELVTKYI